MENNEEKPKMGKGQWRGPENLAHRTGRVPGTKNKQTSAIRTAYQNLVELNLENMSLWIGQVAAQNPEKAMDLMIKLSEYVIPKMSRTEVTGANGEDLFKNLTFEFGTPVNEREIDITDVEWEQTNEE